MISIEIKTPAVKAKSVTIPFSFSIITKPLKTAKRKGKAVYQAIKHA